MITIHHLGVSQSDRVVWLMEELELPYELKWYNRGEDFLAPPEYRALQLLVESKETESKLPLSPRTVKVLAGLRFLVQDLYTLMSFL